MAEKTTNFNLTKDSQDDFFSVETVNNNFDILDSELKKVSDKASIIQKARGTSTAIELSDVYLVDGFQKTFIVIINNRGAATKINGKNLYKPDSNSAPNLVSGKAVTVWYDATGDCFFIKASAEGTALAEHVLAGKKFSNDDDIGITGVMVNNGSVNQSLVANGTYKISQGYHDGTGEITQTLTTKGASTITPNTVDQTIAANQYLTGVQTIKGDANLVSANIKSGVSIFGKVGTSVQAEGIYNFPLSIQDDQPTAIRPGHIWVKSATLNSQIDSVHIVDYMRESYSNGILCFAVGDRTSLQTSCQYVKTLTDGGTRWFGDGINTSVEATWTVSLNTNGMSQYINYRPPIVYSKIGGVQDIETAYMWNGSAWVMLSQKGNFVLVISSGVLKLNNISGESTAEVQNLAITYANDEQISSISADGTFLTRYDAIFKRYGNLFAAYSFIKTYTAYGRNSSVDSSIGVYKYTLTGDGSALLVAAVCLNGVGNQLEVTLLTFKNNGSAFSFTSSARARTSALNSGAIVSEIATNFEGDVVAISYQYASGQAVYNYTSILFKQPDGTYSLYNQDLTSAYINYYGAYIKYLFIGGKLYVIGLNNPNNNQNSYYISRWNIDKVAKTVTLSTAYSITSSGWLDKNSFAQVGSDFLMFPVISASPYFRAVNIHTGANVAVQYTGYDFVAGDYTSGISIAVNANNTIAVLSPYGADYTLKFRITYNSNSITLTFIDKIIYSKVLNAYSSTYFLPDKSRS